MNFACFGKHPFSDKPKAERAAKRLRRRTEDIIHAYRCNCGAWHVGQSTGRKIKTKEQRKGRRNMLISTNYLG